MTQYSEDRPVEIGELGSWELLGGFTHAPEFEDHVQLYERHDTVLKNGIV